MWDKIFTLLICRWGLGLIYKSLKADEDARCVFINQKTTSRKFGLACNHLLAKRNSAGQLAGKFNCRHCKTKYEIIDNKLIVLEV